MPIAALLRSFTELVKLALHGTFPSLGAFRPVEVEAGTCSSAPYYSVIQISCRKKGRGWQGSM